MDRATLDAALNNAAAVKNSAQIVADWQARSARVRAKYPDGLDLRYGPAQRNRIDYFAAKKDSPLLVFIHGGYWQMREKETFTFIVPGPLAHGISVALVAGQVERAQTEAERQVVVEGDAEPDQAAAADAELGVGAIRFRADLVDFIGVAAGASQTETTASAKREVGTARGLTSVGRRRAARSSLGVR